jgi:hypothetical protein
MVALRPHDKCRSDARDDLHIKARKIERYGEDRSLVHPRVASVPASCSSQWYLVVAGRPQASLIPPVGQALGQSTSATDLDLPGRRVVGDRVDAAVVRQHRRRGLGAPARDPHDAVGRVAHQGQPVGDRDRSHAVLVDHTRLVHERSAPTIQQHDALAAYALGQILVRRADPHLLHASGVNPAVGAGGQGVVRLELHHRPAGDPQRPRGTLAQLELRQQLGVDLVAALVAVEELVAERLDHMVEGDRDVGRALLAEQGEQGPQQPAGRPHLAAVRRGGCRSAIVLAEELVGPVDEVEQHAWRVAGSRRPVSRH